MEKVEAIYGREVVEALQRLDAKFKDRYGVTALHIAAELNMVDHVRKLLELGADPNTADDFCQTPLHFAAESCSTEAAEILLEKGADPNAEDVYGRSPLELAVFYRCVDMVKEMLPRAKPSLGVLLAAVGDPAMLSLVLNTWSDIVKVYGGEAVLAAIERGALEGAALLIGLGVDPNYVSSRGAALHIAAQRCLPDAVEFLLLSAGARPDVRDAYGRTPLHYVADVNCVKVAHLLVKAGADVNARDRDGKTPLHYAVAKCRIEAIRELAAAGADLNARDFGGRTPLHYAGCSQAAEELLQRGADPRVADKIGWTPLHSATHSENTEMIRLFARYIDVNAADAYGRTPLHIAAWRRLYRALKLLLELGADVNKQDAFWRTPLHYAAMEAMEGPPDVRIVEELLDRGADPNVFDAYGWTPLHYAAAAGCSEAVVALVRRNARLDARKGGGETPLDVSRGEARKLLKRLAERGSRGSRRPEL
jgi:ankyrin repeat protein